MGQRFVVCQNIEVVSLEEMGKVVYGEIDCQKFTSKGAVFDFSWLKAFGHRHNENKSAEFLCVFSSVK